MQPTLKHYIQGRWETGVTLGVCVNPADPADLVAEYARADALQAEVAARAAAAARRSWAASAPQRRADALAQIAEALRTRQDVLASVLAREQGRPLSLAHEEVRSAAGVFQHFAAEALHLGTPDGSGAAPVGTVALIASAAAPLLLPAWQIAPALAWGNSLVFKPAERASASGWHLVELISRAGLPAGVFNLVMGSGRLVGQALVDHPLFDAISFSGPPALAEQLRQRTAARAVRWQVLPPLPASRLPATAVSTFFSAAGPLSSGAASSSPA